MIDSGDDDVVDDETGGTKGVGLAIMNDGDIQQILRQFNSKYGKSNKAGVHHSPTHLLTHSLTHLLTHSVKYIFTPIKFFIRLVYFMWGNNRQLQRLVKLYGNWV